MIPNQEIQRKMTNLIKRPSHCLLTLTAKDRKTLQELAQSYAIYLQEQPKIALADVCFMTNTGSSFLENRLAVVAKSTEHLSDQLVAFSTQSEADGLISGQVQSHPSKIAFLFTGQGSQYHGMGQHLYETELVFRKAIDHCAELLTKELDYPLLHVLYSPSLTPVTENSPLLNQTAYTQPALFAIEYALATLWQSWGIQPDVVMGHSIGEYVAACIAGVFSLEDGLKLIAARGRLMQALPSTGAMIAVKASASQLDDILHPYDREFSIAAINGPQNVVLSGEKASITKLTTFLEAQEIKVTPLAVSHAFHSKLMEPMLEEFAGVATQVRYSSPKISIISNITGTFVTEELTKPGYWCQHVLQPVRFADSIKTLHQSGYDHFLEVGPRPILLGMGRQCLPDAVGVWLPSLQPGQSDWEQMLTSLGELYVRGVEIDWREFYNVKAQKRQLPLPNPSSQQRELLESLVTQKRHRPEAMGQSAWLQQLESLPETNQLTFLQQTIQNMVGEILAGIHPTGSGTELQQHIPKDMLNRPFKTVVDWFKYFGIDLQEKISPLKQGNTILDLCCGYGVAANTLAKEFPSLNIIGVDLHPDETQVKKYMLVGEEEHLPAQLFAHDACEMSSLKTQSVDFCYCMAGIAYVPDGLKMLQETYRVLKIGAKAFFYIMRRDDDIAEGISLSEITQAAQGGIFAIHPFLDKTRAGWESGTIPRPYYEDGVILEMVKNSDELIFPFKYEGSSTSLLSGQRSMEAYYVVGRYSRYSLLL